MTGLAVFLVLLFSLVVAENNAGGDRTKACKRSEDKVSNDHKGGAFCFKIRPCCKEIPECCEEIKDCCQKIQECCEKVKDCCEDVKDSCEEIKDCCEEVKDCCEDVKDCCEEVKDCCICRKLQECCQEETGLHEIGNRCQQLCATSASPTVTTSMSSSSTPGSKSSTSTDSTTTSHTATTGTSSGSSSNSESSTSAGSITSNKPSDVEDSPVGMAVLSCLAVLFVVVVAVAVFFLWRRKRQADGVRKENNQSCLSAAINLEQRQDSQENKRVNIDNASTVAANSRDNDNNDEYTYIDGPAINKGVVRLHQDRPVTTAGEHALTDPSVSGLHSDLPSTYRLARVTDNDAPDSLPPDYFILEKDQAPDAEPTQYFVLEDRSEQDSAADTDNHYFILEDRREGGDEKSVPEVMSSEFGADYFVLEKDGGQESDCVARDEASRGPSEDAEYSRLDPNRQKSEYTTLNHTAQQGPSKGDNPYSLASCLE